MKFQAGGRLTSGTVKCVHSCCVCKMHAWRVVRAWQVQALCNSRVELLPLDPHAEVLDSKQRERVWWSAHVGLWQPLEHRPTKRHLAKEKHAAVTW